MDTSHLEYVAEDLIAHRLQQAGLFVAKPKFDAEGTDLVAFREMADGVKFCRIQCKGRTLKGRTSNVKIPTSYVTRGFIVFLYIEGDTYTGDLYCFFESEIKTWPLDNDSKHTLNLAPSNYKSELARYTFDKSKIDVILDLIQSAEISGEFKHVSHASMNVPLVDVQFSGGCTGTSDHA